MSRFLNVILSDSGNLSFTMTTETESVRGKTIQRVNYAGCSEAGRELQVRIEACLKKAARISPNYNWPTAAAVFRRLAYGPTNRAGIPEGNFPI